MSFDPLRFAKTLDELEAKCGRYAEAAIAEVRWGATKTWLMNLPPDAEAAGVITNPVQLAGVAVTLVSDHDRVRLGFPHRNSETPVFPLKHLPPDSRAEFQRIADETMQDWERAGSPGITPQRCMSAHHQVKLNARPDA